MASVLAAFQAHLGFSDEALAAWLGLEPRALQHLAAQPVPDPVAARFRDRCAAMAASSGCDAFALRLMLRWYHNG